MVMLNSQFLVIINEHTSEINFRSNYSHNKTIIIHHQVVLILWLTGVDCYGGGRPLTSSVGLNCPSFQKILFSKRDH